MDLTLMSTDNLVKMLERRALEAQLLAEQLEPLTAELKRRSQQEEEDRARRPRPH